MDIGYNRQFAPDNITELKKNEIFVFGSNRSGFHVGGNAKIARNRFGAVYGQPSGLQGESYAIPTFPGDIDFIRKGANEFLHFAAHEGKDYKFYVTPIGCGTAGHTAYDIAPLFIDAVDMDNIILPKQFVEVLSHHPRYTGIPRLTWDSHFDFLDKYEYYSSQLANGNQISYETIKQLRVKTYWNTIYLANLGFYYTEVNSKVELPDAERMKNGTIFYNEEFDVNNVPSLPQKTVIEIVQSDCIDYAMKLISERYYPAVLNMASNVKPGGGVLKGSAAQEESIFRRTNLFQSLYQFVPFTGQFGIKERCDHYPMDQNFGGIYTPEVTLFRDTEKRGYKLMETPQHISFISVAALKKPKLITLGHSSKFLAIDPDLVPTVKNKIRTILRIGLRHRHDTLVLGAWGCGAYANPPQHIAALFHEVLEEKEFKNKYRKIVFAIIDDHNTHKPHNPQGNLLPFQKEFNL